MRHSPEKVRSGSDSAEVEVLGYGFRYVGRTEWSLRDADFRIEPGERILLTGPSGSGKSTLLAAMAGLLGPDAGDAQGTVRVDGRPARETRDQVGIVFQDPDSQLVLSRAGDEVAFGLENRGVPADQIWPRVRAALDAVGFGYPLDRSTQALSGGEKQRLVLAGALVTEPGLLLLDEPTSQLDPDGADLIRAAVARILATRNTTLILVDHDADPWLPLIDRVIELPLFPTQGGPESSPANEGGPESNDSNQGRPESVKIGWNRASARLLSAEGVGFSYPGAAADPPALAPTDIELYAGQVTAITGPNGSGKSTLGLLLGGLQEPTVGRILASPELAGALGDRPPHRWRARDLVHRIGTVFQNPEHQFLTGRVRDELSLGPLRAGATNPSAHDRAEALMVRLGLTSYAEANPFTLSGGQQRRLSVATALATRPDVLILDEPTFGQDPVTWAELVALLTEARDAGTAICMISHDRRLVDALADQEIRLGRPARTTSVDHRNTGGFSPAGPLNTPANSDDQLQQTSAAAAARVWLGRINPVAQILAILLITFTALATVDLLTPAVLVAAEITLLPAAGLIRPRAVFAKTWPLLLGAAGIGWANLLFSAGGGWNWVESAALALRVIAVALPGVLFIASTDPVRVADALTIHWRVSTRWAFGALAAIRLAPLLATEWRAIRLARRARGVDPGRNPLAAGRLAAGAAFTLLVVAIRRGARLALAMDARGFDSTASIRTNARGSVLRRRDYAFVATVALLCAAVTTLAVTTGLWHPVFTS